MSYLEDGIYMCACVLHLMLYVICVCMCVQHGGCVCVCVYTHIYIQITLSRYHIVEALMVKGHRVTAHAAHALRPEYWVVRFQRHKLGQTLGWFQGCSPAFQLIPRSQETWLDRHYSKDLKLIVHVGYPCPLCLPRWRQDRKDGRKGI